MIHIATAADHFYAPGLHVTVASSLRFLSPTEEITFHILDGGLAPDAIQQLKSLCAISHPQCFLVFHKINQEHFKKWRPLPNGPTMAYARLFLGSLLKTSKVIYLDSDLIILDDLTKLWNSPMNGKIILACRGGESAILENDCPWPLLPSEKELPYFNSGVMLLDLEQWRLQKVEEQVLALVTERPSTYRHYDQTILNYLLRYHCGLLPIIWNWQGRIITVEHATSVNIIHFITPKKPWFWWSGDLRFKLWRYCYATFIGSTIKLFLSDKTARSGFLYGMFEIQIRRYPLLRKIYTTFLSLSSGWKKNALAAEQLKIIKEYYTQGQGGKNGDAEFAKDHPAFKILLQRIKKTS